MRDFSLQFFLKVGDLLITIPVNPEELEINKEIGYDTYANLNKKEILKLQEDKLIELELESILEKTVSSASVVDKPWSPIQYLNTFNSWKDNRTVVRVTSSDGQIDFEGYIVSVNTMYEGGTDDYGYGLTIIQERSIELLTNVDNGYTKIDIEYQVLRYTPKTNPTTPTNTNNSTTNTSNSNNSGTVTYTVKSGDTLSGIARMYYGNSSKWPDIFNANKDKIKNANLIYPGQVLTIPNSDGTVKSSTSSSSTKSTSNKSSSSTKNSSTKSTTETKNIVNNKPETTGNEGKPFYDMIQGVEFWGQGKLAEYDEKYNEKHKGMWCTYFYFDSGTYQILGNKGDVEKVGYISSYTYYGGKKLYDKSGKKVG